MIDRYYLCWLVCKTVILLLTDFHSSAFCSVTSSLQSCSRQTGFSVRHTLSSTYSLSSSSFWTCSWQSSMMHILRSRLRCRDRNMSLRWSTSSRRCCCHFIMFIIIQLHTSGKLYLFCLMYCLQHSCSIAVCTGHWLLSIIHSCRSPLHAHLAFLLSRLSWQKTLGFWC